MLGTSPTGKPQLTKSAGFWTWTAARSPLLRREIDGHGAAGGYRTYDLSLTKGVLYH
jgi:hypothetical protein